VKIDKIIFSSSEEYSVFWNLQSEAWNSMGISPVLLLFGKKKNTDIDGRFGTILEMEYSSDAIKSLQLTWSKVHHTHTEPDTTWIIGDIDLLPLQKDWFTKEIEEISEEYYAHLACTHLGSWHTTDKIDLPAYYHVAKGRIFNKVYKLDTMTLVDYVNFIISTHKYGRNITDEYKKMTVKQIADSVGKLKINHAMEPFWCADENYSSHILKNACFNGEVNWVGKTFDVVDWQNPYNSKRIDRNFWNSPNYDMVDMTRLRMRKYIDIHCTAPFPFEAQKDCLNDIMQMSKMVLK
jgi:hypothetical protein